MQLADPTLAGARGSSRMEERLGSTFVRRLELERSVQLLDRPFRIGEAAVHDAGDVPALVGQRLAGAIRARDLEQRDLGVTDREVVSRGLDEAPDQ